MLFCAVMFVGTNILEKYTASVFSELLFIIALTGKINVYGKLYVLC